MSVLNRETEQLTSCLEVNKLPIRISEFATHIWTEMRFREILPTPQAYAVWFAYRLGNIPDLTKRLDGLLERHVTLTPALLQGLYTELVLEAGSETQSYTAGDAIDEIGDIAGTLTEHIAGGQGAIAEYAAVLAQWLQRIGGEPTVVSLITAVSALTAETMRAAEGNRELQQKLSVSVGRIAQLRRSLSEVKQEATTDQLTGIANRRAFSTRLRRTLAQARADPTYKVSLLMLDVDHFKHFNDTYGHKTGDLVLRLVARLLSDHLKGRDLVARYGGEEFAIILVGADLNAAAIVGRQICESLSVKRLGNKGTQLQISRITISAGAAQFRTGDSPASLVARADAALYLAKNRGRNQICADGDAATP